MRPANLTSPPNRARNFVAGFILLAVVAGAGFLLYRETTPEVCRICHRTIHMATRVVIEQDDKREIVCCPRCALHAAAEQKRPVRLVEVHDLFSGQAVSPEEAYYVEGSRVMACCGRNEPMLDETRHPYVREFDRCLPSVIAFVDPGQARDFAAHNGGKVVRLADLMLEMGLKRD